MSTTRSTPGVGGCKSYSLRRRNRGVGSHTQNRNGFPVGRGASVIHCVTALDVPRPPVGSGQVRGLRCGHLRT